MNSSRILALIAIGIAAIFGLQGALKLAINHSSKEKKQITPCKNILILKEAYFLSIPIAYLAVIFYVILIFQLILLTQEEEINLYWINIEILFSIFVSVYYAFIMFLKLQIICVGCFRIYLANFLMGASLMYYHFT